MFLANASTKRPIAMSCLLIALVALGLNSFRKLAIENMPAVDIPYIAVVTTWVGASPEDVEKDVSKYVEDAVSGIDGLKGFDVGGWYGIYGPKGMSPELTAKLNKAVNAALKQPDLSKRLKELGYDEWTGEPQKLAERAAKERAMWATVTQGIVVD